MEAASLPLASLIAAIALVGLAPNQAVAEFNVPSLTSPVMDTAGLLSRSSKARLERALQALKRQGGTQLAVLTVPTLDGLTIEQASIRVTDQWQLGSEQGDNGVLLMIEGVKSGDLAQGMCGAIARCGELLAPHFPIAEGDANELRDHLVVKD